MTTSGTNYEAQAIRTWLIDQVASAGGYEPSAVDPSLTINELVLDSLRAARIVVDLEAWLDRPVDPEVLLAYPTIEDLAQALARGEG